MSYFSCTFSCILSCHALGPYGWGQPPILSLRKLGHVDLRCAIVNQKVHAGLVVNEKVTSADNVADFNTKPSRGEPYLRLVRPVASD
eukprot:g78086.t1